MSELELSEKIATLIDETKMFEKIADVTVNIGICISAFGLFASFVGFTNIALHYSNINSNNKNNKFLSERITSISKNIEINRIIYDNKIIELEYKLIESQQNCLNEIKKLKSEKKITISKSTSISDLAFISDEEKKVNDEENQEEDDELINECYDSLPLNNFKKNTKSNWLF
jgi:hypothetical protein